MVLNDIYICNVSKNNDTKVNGVILIIVIIKSAEASKILSDYSVEDLICREISVLL